MTSTGCDGTQVTGQCTCQSDEQGAGVWECVQSTEPECADAQPPGCPDASTVVPDDACDVSPQQSCGSDVQQYDCSGNVIGNGTCRCVAGAWSCNITVPACPPSGCPDPESVEQGVPCTTPGVQCSGNPTSCDGAVFYDAFECDDGAWNDVAATTCDGSSSGGGGPVDAGFADAKGM
jgi:hypothetical protein